MVNDDCMLIFDESSKKRILSSLGISTNDEFELIDEDNKVLTNQDFESIKLNEFGGILVGSKIPIKNDRTELVKYFLK